MSSIPLQGQVFRRHILLDAKADKVFAALEDDVHHFDVELVHDGSVVRSVRSTSHRTPRTNCGDASEPLRGFEGLELAAEEIPLDPRKQCTHLYELVRLAMRAALRGGRRVYEIEVPLWIGPDSKASLRVDGKSALDWLLRDQVVTTPGMFEGVDLKGRVTWPAGLDDETLEAAKVLRRGVWIAGIRSRSIRMEQPIDFPVMVKEIEARQRGVCFAHQPGVQERGTSTGRSNMFDFTNRPDALLEKELKPLA